MFWLFYYAQSLYLSKSDSALSVYGQGFLKKSEFNIEYNNLLNTEGATVLNITKLELDDRIHTIEAGSFDMLFLYLEEVYLPSLISLSDGVFGQSFNRLNNVTFESTILYIGANFQGTKNLTLHIPASVERIHPITIQSVKSFTLDSGNKNYAVCNVLDTRYLLYPNKSTIYAIADTYDRRTSIRFPDCIKSIFEMPSKDIKYFFDYIDFNKVERIESKFFSDTDVSSVTKLNLENVRYLGPGSLKSFTKVTEPIYISNSLEEVHPDAFLPQHTFRYGSKANLMDVTIDGHRFMMKKDSNTLLHYFPTQSNKGSSIKIASHYKLQPGLFQGHQLGHITIDKMSSVGSRAFDGSSFTEVTFEDGVKRIEDYSFSNILGDIQVIINFCSTIEYIGSAAFKNTRIIISDNKLPSSLKEISNEAFMNSYDGSDLQFPTSLTKIGDSAFEGCIHLSAINFGQLSINDAKVNMITHYGINAFKNTSIAIFPLGSVVTYIGSGAFAETTSFIGDVNFESGVITDGENSSIIYVSKVGVLPLQYIYPNVTTLRDYAFMDVFSDRSLFNFTGIQSIGVGTFQNCSIETIILGPELTKIPESAFLNATINNLIFQADHLQRIYKNGIYGLSTYNMSIPKINRKSNHSVFINILSSLMPDLPTVNVQFENYTVNIQRNFSLTTITFNGETIPRNEYIECSTSNQVVFNSSVRNIQYGCLDYLSAYAIVLEEGVETIEPYSFDSLKVSQITFPSTMKSVNPSMIPICLLNLTREDRPWEIIKFSGSDYKVEGSFILSDDGTVQMCSFLIGDIDEISFKSDITEISPYCFRAFPEQKDVIIPGSITKIGEYIFSAPVDSLVISEGCKDFGTQNVDIRKISLPATLEDIHHNMLGKYYRISNGVINSDNISIAYGCKATIQDKGILYDKNRYHAFSVSSRYMTEISIDCDIVDMNVLQGINTAQTIEFSSKVREIRGSVQNLPGVKSVIPPKLKYYLTDQYKMSCFYGTVDLDPTDGYNPYIEDKALPDGVTHIYVRMREEPEGTGQSLLNQPWVHVPLNYDPSKSTFMGVPILRDLPPILDPVEEDEEEEQKTISVGAMVGIGVGCGVFVVAVIVVIVWFTVFKKRQSDSEPSEFGPPEVERLDKYY